MIACFRFVTVFVLCFQFSEPCSAQIELSVAYDIAYPQIVTSGNKLINSGQLGYGLKMGLVYKPERTQFFPKLDFSYGRARVPLQFSNENVAALNFNYWHVVLDENYAITFTRSTLYLYGGIGFSYLNEKGPAPSGNQSVLTAVDSASNITKIFPAVNLGLEYNYGEQAGKDFFMSLGMNFQYMLLLEGRNIYYLTVGQPGNNFYHYRSTLTGNLISPEIYIALHYKIHRKKNSFYL